MEKEYLKLLLAARNESKHLCECQQRLVDCRNASSIGKGDTTSKCVFRQMDLEHAIDTAQRRFDALKLRIGQMILADEHPVMLQALYWRCVPGFSWEKTCKLLGNRYTPVGLRRSVRILAKQCKEPKCREFLERLA